MCDSTQSVLFPPNNFLNSDIKEFVVSTCNVNEIKSFINYWHYTHDINGLTHKYCFKLQHCGETIGAAIFGELGMANTWKKFGDNKEDVLELKRLCCVDKTPKNTESYFISKCLKWLKHNTTVISIVSYADPHYNHDGTIYRASNFEYVGQSPKSIIILYKNKRYHDHAVRTKYKGKLKPFAIQLARAIKTGEATVVEQEGKMCYVYTFKRRNRMRVRNLSVDTPVYL